jgi:hypothetical protein
LHLHLLRMTSKTTYYVSTHYESTHYEPTHYEIKINPIFVTDGIEYIFEGLHKDINNYINTEYIFIINTLREHLGDELDFEVDGNEIEIATLSNSQMKILSGIDEDTFDYPVKYGHSRLKFEIVSYMYDKPPCNGTVSCDCDKCY